MNKKLYTACGAAAIALVACSDDNGRLVGTSVEPNTIGELSSSSVDTPSSSSFDAREGDLWNPSAGGFSLNRMNGPLSNRAMAFAEPYLWRSIL